MSDEPCCKTCKYFSPEMLDDPSCLRHSPRVLVHDIDGVDHLWSVWPVVAPEHWCGEHEPEKPDVPSAAHVASLVASALQAPSGHEEALASALHRVIASEVDYWHSHCPDEFTDSFDQLTTADRARAKCNLDRFLDALIEELDR